MRCQTLQLANHNNGKVRALTISALNQFIHFKPQPLLDHSQDFAQVSNSPCTWF
jgi:hypothetical protein